MAKAFAMGSPCRKVSPMVSPKDSPSGVVGLMTDGIFRLAEQVKSRRLSITPLPCRGGVGVGSVTMIIKQIFQSHSTINIQKAESAVTGETIGETYGETFRHGLPMLIPFVQSTFGRLWGDGDVFFSFRPIFISFFFGISRLFRNFVPIKI